MKLHFLGTGTSTGVPQIGCTCEVCTSTDFRDRRFRTSALVETDAGTRLLLDCGPDFRQQMLGVDFKPLHGVLITHEHYDHVGGLDDLRPFCVFGEINIYGDSLCLDRLRNRMPYCFAEQRYPGVPRLNLLPVSPNRPFTVREQTILPLRVMHGRLPILGYRIGSLAYITDMKTIPAETLAALQGVSTLVVNALRQEPHATHQTVTDAVRLAEQLGVNAAYLIHMSHHAGRHEALHGSLPKGMAPAYDGLTIECV